MIRRLTLHDIPAEVAEALERESHRRRASLDQAVIDLLRYALGTPRREGARNGLAQLAGTWSEEEYSRFETDLAFMEQIDEELWR